MITLLARLFIKDRDKVADAAVRRAYGMLCSLTGIGLNVLLFLGKYLAGRLSGSIAMTADAFNNLSDAGSSVITLLGFRMAAKKPDPGHPFGHGRIEYLSGVAVSIIIIVVGVQLGLESIDKIMNPQPVDAGLLPMLVLVASICVKGYMFAYNRGIGRKINSPGMAATAMDSLSDSIATSVVLISMLLSRFAGVNADGWGGIAVACFIIFSGFKAAKETLSPLLGNPPDPERLVPGNPVQMALRRGDPHVPALPEMNRRDVAAQGRRFEKGIHLDRRIVRPVAETHDTRTGNRHPRPAPAVMQAVRRAVVLRIDPFDERHRIFKPFGIAVQPVDMVVVGREPEVAVRILAHRNETVVRQR